MDKKTRYDLMVQLSDFYVKNVQKNLDGFNKARFIADTSRYISFAIAIIIPVSAISAVLLKHTPIGPFIVTLAFLCPLFAFAGLFYIEKLKEMDDKNIIQVFNQNPTYDEKTLKEMAEVYKYFSTDINKVLEEEKKKSKSITLPMSADDEIKKHLMAKFLKIFGDFSWCKGYNHNKIWKDMKFIKSLKILNNPLSIIDDCITGIHNGINVKIFDANTSVFKIGLITITILFIFWLAGMFIFLLPVLLVILGIFLVKTFYLKRFLRSYCRT